MNNKIGTISLLVVAFIFALILGSNVAAGDYETLSTYAIIGILVYFVVNGWKNVWWFTSLLAFSGVAFTHGFVFRGYHLFGLMVCFASMMAILTGGMSYKPSLIKWTNRHGFLIIPVCFLIYGVLHFFYNMAFPYSPAEYSVKTTSKAYFSTFISIACAVWLLIGPYGFRLKKNWMNKFLMILFIGLAANIVARGFMFGQGFQSTGPGKVDAEEYFFYVPVINMQAGVFTLRWLTPLAIGLAFSLLTLPGWYQRQSRLIKWLTFAIIFLSPVGAVLSGGRASILFCFAVVTVIALMRRKTTVVFSGFTGILLLIGLINLFSNVINENAPLNIARSVQFVMIEKGDAYGSISGSQDVRNLGIEAGLEAWKESPRTLLSGRSVLFVSPEEISYMRNTVGEAGFADLAARTGATHNLVSDLLLQYGLIGLVLYYGAFLSLILYVRSVSKKLPSEMLASKAICDFMKAYLPLLLIYDSLGGGWVPVYVPLLLGIVRADLLRVTHAASEGGTTVANEREPQLSQERQQMMARH